MIRDDRQYRAMQERVLRFRLALTSIETANDLNDPRKRQAGIDAMRAQLDALERELQAYDTKRNRSERDR
jgi:hypothetical protein